MMMMKMISRTMMVMLKVMMTTMKLARSEVEEVRVVVGMNIMEATTKISMTIILKVLKIHIKEI